MGYELLNEPVQVTCGCGRMIQTTLRAVKNGQTVRCSAGHSIKLQEQGHGLADADRSMKQFERKLKEVERKLRR